MKLKDLKPGDKFRDEYITGEVVYIGYGSACVLLDETDEEGNIYKKQTHISRNVEVEKI